MTKKKNKTRNILTFLLIFVIAAGIAISIPLYKIIYAPNVTVSTDNHKKFLYIRTGSHFNDVIKNLSTQHLLKDTSGFRWLAGRMKYSGLVKPGKYLLKDGMCNLILLKILRLGQQTPVEISTNRVRYKEDIASIVGKNLEVDSMEILRILNDEHYLETIGLSSENAMSLFISNTYQFQWNTSAQDFMKRMKAEWDKVWTPDMFAKAKEINMVPAQVMALASIVQEETRHKDEAPTIAGVYLNRLKKDIPLQADPTVKYIKLKENKNAVIQRIYFKDLNLESRYNTYKYKGLPPGPIMTPELWAIEAVLDADKHDYLFFVARGDGSGYSHFSKTGAEHEQYSKEYHQSLDRNGTK